MRYAITMAFAGFAAVPATAATINVTVDIPSLKVAEYHRPYVAAWIEGANGAATNLQLWYDYDNRENGGTKWLAELRQWWRKTGRTTKVPADGLTGATRAPGPQKITAAPKLAPGSYTLLVEAARENGGREVVRVPFAWPPKGAQTAQAKGSTELGTVAVTVAP